MDNLPRIAARRRLPTPPPDLDAVAEIRRLAVITCRLIYASTAISRELSQNDNLPDVLLMVADLMGESISQIDARVASLAPGLSRRRLVEFAGFDPDDPIVDEDDSGDRLPILTLAFLAAGEPPEENPEF